MRGQAFIIIRAGGWRLNLPFVKPPRMAFFVRSQPLNGRSTSSFIAALDDLCDADVIAVIAHARLRRSAPVVIQHPAADTRAAGGSGLLANSTQPDLKLAEQKSDVTLKLPPSRTS